MNGDQQQFFDVVEMVRLQIKNCRIVVTQNLVVVNLQVMWLKVDTMQLSIWESHDCNHKTNNQCVCVCVIVCVRVYGEWYFNMFNFFIDLCILPKQMVNVSTTTFGKWILHHRMKWKSKRHNNILELTVRQVQTRHGSRIDQGKSKKPETSW